jgi:hypothetical protein
MASTPPLDELAVLAARCLHIVRSIFVGQSSDVLPMYEDMIQTTLATRNMRGMRAVHREMCVMAASTLSTAKRATLDQELQENWGQGLSNGKKRRDPTGARDVVARGINSQAEYELVARRAIKIERDPGGADEFELLGRAMMTFREQKKIARD